MTVRDRACPRVLSVVYPSRTRGLLSDRQNGQRALARLAVQPPIRSLRMRSLVGSMTTTAPSLSSCSTAARFASRSPACCSGRLLTMENRRDLGTSARVASRGVPRCPDDSHPWWIESRAVPSLSPEPKTCPHDLSPRQHP